MARLRRYRHPLGLDGAGCRAYVAGVLFSVNQASALLSVLIIDIVLAGDNAIVVGMAAAGLPARRRRRVIAAGIGAATVLRILFAFVAVELLQTVIGVTLAGGLLLFWVAWKLQREIAAAHPVGDKGAELGARRPREKTQAQALLQIVVADLSMSLDNVLAVAGVARDHPLVLVVGLVVSVALMGVASTYVARLLDRAFWLSWVGLGIITLVAMRMIWEGSSQILHGSAALGIGLA
ncbi:MAG TPA: YjbE family putative metal transport protein [Stellaceae bacterium]|nr:YjbE family putative metal transport protein [Stellaceae bacterium]